MKMSKKSSTLPPQRGDLVICDAYDGEPYVCVGWIGTFFVLMPLKKSEMTSKFWFENWESIEDEKGFEVISLPDPVREAWANILPKTITPEPGTDLK